MKKTFLLLLFIFIIKTARADEGMWLPFLLQQLNSQELYIRGLKIPVEEIYSVNKGSLKDGVVLFGGGCTGEIISNDGLLLTNHHCGNSSIQSHSTTEHNYLRDGFWSMDRTQELPCPGLTVTFIISMTDVSNQITPSLNDSMTEAERTAKIEQLAGPIEKSSVAGTHYKSQIKSFFEGNMFVLIVSEVFKDIRMVGAPPYSIGNFGDETDNWMWPRHTADFSLFRIYSGKDNKPAEYNSENIPFHPRYSFTISAAGVKEGDFTMVYGFPGTTREYIPADAVDLIVNVSNPNRISIRDKKIAVMEKYMQADESVFIQYAAKIRTMANAYKKWKGEISGLKKLDAITKKHDQEAGFTIWADADPARKKKYGNVLPQYHNIYKDYQNITTAADYYTEAGLGIEVVNFSSMFRKLVELSSEENPDEKKISDEAARLLKGSEGYFKNYCLLIDKELAVEMLKLYNENVDVAFQPSILNVIHEKYRDDYKRYVESLFAKSVFTSTDKLKELLVGYTSRRKKNIENDPVWQLFVSLNDAYVSKVQPIVLEKKTQLTRLNRIYMNGLMEMMEGRKFYPDANLTLRLTFGTVAGYNPRDGVHYDFSTSIEGIIQKNSTGNEDYKIPERLLTLYNNHDYGSYSANGTIPIAFIATNHTTGGNSGSPVLNDKGQLVGVNFDRVWEGTMSDIMFNPDQCRNITVDIRYILFIIDKFAGAPHLIKEMNIIN
ncbi:MAG: S46 family peptidase [Bacteroidota bacterium]